MKILFHFLNENFTQYLGTFDTKTTPYHHSISTQLSHKTYLMKKQIFLPIFILKNSSVRMSCSIIFFTAAAAASSRSLLCI